VNGGCDYVIQGIAAEFEKPFQHKDDIFILKSGCFDESLRSHNVKLMLNHDSNAGMTMRDLLQVYSGAKSLAFRCFLPQDLTDDGLSDVADDMEHYRGVSIGHIPTKTETQKIDGIDVTLVYESDLTEISILDNEPAIKTTYAYVASLDSCCDIDVDYKAGLFDLRGKLIGLHRKVTANENGEEIKYKHSTSPSDRAANRFKRLLAKLA
jgi:phage head maturation protease